jgi:hypothetical protein
MRTKAKSKPIKLKATTWVLGDKPIKSLKLIWADNRKGQF